MPRAVVRGLIRTLQTDWRVSRSDGLRTDRFEDLYRNEVDPWAISVSPMAHQRSVALLEAISQFTPCRSILDVGCGEGQFTRLLTGLSHKVTGLDVSPSALGRARGRVPRAEFVCATLNDYRPAQVFDLVLASEVLYYIRPVEDAIERLLNLGNIVFVTYARKHRHHVERTIESHPRLEHLNFCPFFGTTTFGFTIARFKGSARSTRGAA